MKNIVVGMTLLTISAISFADEGMWTFQNFPADAVKKKYGVQIEQSWLDRLQRATTRLEGGCTGSFVSPDGLVLTNHHCVIGCVSDLATPEQDLIANGFHAQTQAQERKCPTEMLSVLIEAEDVTAKVMAATAGMKAAEANEARKRELSRLEAECTAASQKHRAGALACESVTLYQGGQYFLHKYKRYDDVRIVFAPEHSIAAFGGDPDNFNFPRWSLDFSLLRAYENGKPASTPNYLRWRTEGASEGEVVFVSGHPGSTNRLLTVEQLKFQRDVNVPSYLIRNSELRGRIIQWGKSGEEPLRIIQRPLQSLENSLKVYRGFQQALANDELFEYKHQGQDQLESYLSQHPDLAAEVGNPWREIALAQQRFREIFDDYLFLESAAGFNSKLFAYARQLVRGTAEREKPNEARLREYAESNLQKIENGLLAQTPVYPEYEQVTLSFSLEKLREHLGPDHAIVRALLVEESPDGLARQLISATKLADPAVRKQLWQGGSAAVQSSEDPMIVLARQIDEPARAVRKIYEDEVQAPVAANQERLAKVRFAALGTNTYPDATFTLRVSYGAVQGWKEKGKDVVPFTRLGRLYERATGEEPFRLPQPWLDAQERLDMSTPFNFVATTDVVGGNSGSPLVDSQGRIVGLVFDGNIHSLSGNYWYDADLNRSVFVHPSIIVTALRDVYGAQRIVTEITRASSRR